MSSCKVEQRQVSFRHSVRCETGERYDGELDFASGEPHGFGVLTHLDGSTYRGQFYDGKKQGLGMTIFANGDKHVGEYSEDEIGGHGTFIVSDTSARYIGEFHKGQFHGRVKGKYSSGEMFHGDYQYGNCNSATDENQTIVISPRSPPSPPISPCTPSLCSGDDFEQSSKPVSWSLPHHPTTKASHCSSTGTADDVAIFGLKRRRNLTSKSHLGRRSDVQSTSSRLQRINLLQSLQNLYRRRRTLI